MKKILFFIDKVSSSGASKIIVWLANRCVKCDYLVYLVSYIESEDIRVLDKNVKKIVLKSNSNKITRAFNVILQLRNIISKKRIDLCVGFLPIDSLYLQIATLLKKTKVIVCERSDPYLENSRLASIARKFYCFADAYVFQTKAALNYFHLLKKNKSIIIPNPVLKKTIDIVPIDKRKNALVTSGRLFIKQKRQDVLLKAFSILLHDFPTLYLDIYGSGPDENILREMTKSLNIEGKVFFKGNVPSLENEINRYLLFIFSSDYEGIPNSVIEAMQCGLAVVATDCSPGGIRTLINDSLNGYIVPRGSYVEMANKVSILLKNKHLLKQFSIEASKITESLDEDKIFSQWYCWFEYTLNK